MRIRWERRHERRFGQGQSAHRRAFHRPRRPHFIGSFVQPNFLTFDNLVQNVASRTAFFAISAIGATFVMAAGGLDLSVGSMAAFTAVAMLIYLKSAGAGVEADVGTNAVGMVIAIAVGAASGAANGLIISAWVG